MTEEDDINPEPIAALAEALAEARTVLVLSGSGLSADSGVPTFRDVRTGIWAHHRPEDVATPEAFERDPGFVWQWYRERRRLARSVEPNAGHDALAELEQRLPDLRLVTQNVDGLHQRAGHRGPVRPAVVWFGEMIPGEALERAGAAGEACDLFLAVGTSAEVHPAAGLADTARRRGARIAEINPAETALSAGAGLRITERAAEALPRVLAALTSR